MGRFYRESARARWGPNPTVYSRNNREMDRKNRIDCRGVKKKVKQMNIPASNWESNEIRNCEVGERGERRVRRRFETLNGRNPRRVLDI